MEDEKQKPLKVVRLEEAITAYENGHIDKVSPETFAKMQYAKERIAERIKGK